MESSDGESMGMVGIFINSITEKAARRPVASVSYVHGAAGQITREND